MHTAKGNTFESHSKNLSSQRRRESLWTELGRVILTMEENEKATTEKTATPAKESEAAEEANEN
ncbi:hypothetical protein N7527_011548 [Penicillium freii]|nr:hypothetical protein N7527_011548 [Penicillium freii]